MNKYIAFILALCMMLSLCACGGTSTQPAAPEAETTVEEPAAPANRLEEILAAGKIVMATSPDYPPYEFEDLTKSGQDAYVGADIEMAKYIADSLGVELEIKAMSFDAVLASITEGTADIALAGLTDKEERRSAMDFSTPYYVEVGQIMIVKTENKDLYSSLDDFANLNIAVQNGSFPMAAVETCYPDATITPVVQVTDGLLMVKEGKVDAMCLTYASACSYTENDEGLFMYPDPLESHAGGSIVVAVVKDEPELLAAINEITTEINEANKFTQWLEEANILKSELGL